MQNNYDTLEKKLLVIFKWQYFKTKSTPISVQCCCHNRRIAMKVTLKEKRGITTDSEINSDSSLAK